MTKDERLQTIENCMAWVDEGGKGRRMFGIDYNTGQSFRVWCYDFDLMTGKHIHGPGDVINMEAEKDRQERADYERLAKKFAA